MFGSHFITCNQAPRPLASLLSLSIREGETLKTYSDRYWEMFNEIDGDFEDVAISTFKLGLPAEHGLRKSLTGKPVTSVCQLMDRIDKYKRVEEDHQHDKGKGKVIPQEMRDFKSDCTSKRFCQTIWTYRPSSGKCRVLRTGASGFREDQERAIKSKPLLPVPPRSGAYHRGLQNSVEPSGATSQGGEVATIFVSTQSTRRPVKIRG